MSLYYIIQNVEVIHELNNINEISRIIDCFFKWDEICDDVIGSPHQNSCNMEYLNQNSKPYIQTDIWVLNGTCNGT